MKRFSVTNTSHELETVGFAEVTKSGDNYIYIVEDSGSLKIYYHTQAEDIVTNGTLAETRTNLQATKLPGAIRTQGSRVHLC